MHTESDIDLGGATDPRFPFGFPVSTAAWREYDGDDLLTSAGTAGRDFALRLLGARVNRRRRETGEEPLRAGELLVMALLHEILRYIMEEYCDRQRRGACRRAVEWSDERRGEPTSGRCADAFADAFVSMGTMDTPRAAEEMVLVALAAENPALEPYRELIDDRPLQDAAPYPELVEALEAYFAGQPPVDGVGLTLFRVLRAPMEASPDSLAGQLDYILEHFRALLPPWLVRRLLTTRDVLHEETQARGGPPGVSPVLRFGAPTEEEAERFTADREWMSDVVLMAKLGHVWLHQLSRWYGRSITRLDQIPDEELDRLARWGFTALWIIGVWERSPASREIKRRTGNEDALASAYSLYDYVIAEDLGGEEAYRDLSGRAWDRGIRLATDMVPNHTGIYSKLVMERPDWFVQVDHPPFPGYSFTGPDLCPEPGVELRIEDGYWTRQDAAVVFERRQGGDVRYIYHGNDGTHMPWNDTAQLDYLNGEVREAIVQTILQVARRFPIIRFDAAMTLAKRHVQRLWYPPPGEGGAIPSRARFGMTHEEFERRLPKEFWREVVDRVQQEAPDTLLLAEAFWLMEGYFVRTLGMHRVYNSAFMNMLKMEDNAEYRDTVKNVLEFSPQVLERFVNFMSNPDERTAIEQFGSGDKYYGVALLLVTMPGLPMFGHGQIEMFTEKYGMEFGRAYRDEDPDRGAVDRHRREIFPLMRKRHLFSHAEHFALYDFRTSGPDDGACDENVFAYSNRAGDERAVVFYHNAYAETAGWIRTSTPIHVATGGGVDLVRRTLGEALGLRGEDGVLYRFRDHGSGLEFLRWGRDLIEHGLWVSLGAYDYHVFLDFADVDASDETWRRLAQRLDGRGVPSLEAERRALLLEPVTRAFGDFVRAVRDGKSAEKPLRAFLDVAGVERPKPALKALERGLETRERLEDALSDAPKVVDDLLPESDAPLATVLSVLRALPTDRVGEWTLASVAADTLDAPELAGLVPLLLDEDLETDDVGLLEAARDFLGVHDYEGTEWFTAERLEALVDGRRVACVLDALEVKKPSPKALRACRADAERWRVAADASGYRFADLLAAFDESPEEPPPRQDEGLAQRRKDAKE
ncbi:MAG: alpha-amylase family glycosyl hydrolase [Myxococcota bacterium]